MSSREYFKTVASKWDQMRSTFFSEAVRDRALEVAAIQKGKLAADLGAGTGFVTAALVKNGLRVIAVDQSPEMLDQIKAKFGSVDQVECRLGVAEKLPVQDSEADYVFANMYLHHVESPPIAITEMVRILKSNGIMVITDLDRHNHQFLLVEHHDRWLGFKREQIKQWFEEAGLTDVAVDCVGESCCAAPQAGGDCVGVSIFVASGRK